MSRRALQRAAADTGVAAARLAVACLALGAGWDLADRMLNRLTIPVALVVVAVVLALAGGWWTTVRTGHDLTRLQHRHEDDQHSIAMLKRDNANAKRDNRHHRVAVEHLLAVLREHRIEVSLPLPRTGTIPAATTLDEQPTGGER